MTEPDPTAEAFDVVGIGNALVDVLSHEEDAFLEANGLVKASMTLIDTDRAEALYAAMSQGLEMSGGSAANTIAGIASFGGRAAYIGRVFDDELGTVFAHDMRATGAVFRSVPATEGPPTGRCLIVVTPDAQRTMNTYLGSSEFLGPEHVDEALIASAQVTYLEGYLFDRAPAQEAYWKASQAAHEAGRRVSLTLSDTFCVERHRAAWRDLVADQVDILFANEEEAKVLYEVDTFDEALAAARADVEVAAVTRGGKGSVVARGDEVAEVAAHPVEKVIDTTGAGDLYAAGFLFAFTSGRSMADCGRFGSVAASAVIGHTGPRPGLSLAQLADTLQL
ncbi:MAG: adenosine kinase [Acidimicrobiales bacterium]|nr:adenosine kinase [Acidimicrobiales bacterium]